MIEIPQQHYLYFCVVHCMIPYSFYNINNINNCITFQLLNVQTGYVFLTNSVFINAGNYNAIQLAVHLTDILTINNFIVQYNGIINKFKFTNSQYNFRFLSGTTTCLNMLGLSKNDALNTSILQSYTSVNQINLATQSCLCITSIINTGSINNSNVNDMNIPVSIPLMSLPYSVFFLPKQ